MHEQVVARICFETHGFGYTGAVRHCGYACVADERVDLAALLAEEVHELYEEHSAGGGNHEGKQTQQEDLDGPCIQEHVGLCGGTHGEADERGGNVDDGAAGILGQAPGDSAFLQQVAEEEHSQKRQARRNDECGAEEAYDGEYYLFALRHLAGRSHADEALLLGGEQQHYGLLYDRHQGHVRIGRDGYSSHKFRSQLAAEEDGGGTVGSAYDTDGSGFVGREA